MQEAVTLLAAGTIAVFLSLFITAPPHAPLLREGGRSVRVDWPAGTPRGVVVFLHGLSRDPLDEEGPAMAAISQAALERGFIAVFPIAHRACGAQRCWQLDDVDGELDAVSDILDEVERQAGMELPRRHIIGFSNGGFLVGAALQRNMLAGFTRVGVVAGGAVGDVEPRSALPRVFLEVGNADRWQGPTTHALYDRLTRARPGDDVQLRVVRGGHDFDAERAAAFLDWFWGERAPSIATPKVRPK